VEPEAIARAVAERYGKDRTFSAPILTMCAIAGRLGSGPDAWQWVLPLPFELAAFPHRFFAWLRLPVVSYALPALIAVGVARHRRLPAGNALRRLLRNLAERKTLATLERIQPASGGYLEAVPLTSFVVMSLVAAGLRDHPVVERGVRFLTRLARDDGSWPIDTNLATWVTTLAVNALAGGRRASPIVSPEDDERLRGWLLDQQYQKTHPYTHAAPGGWAWTDLPGGVPDADDTAGAIRALRALDGGAGAGDERARRAAAAGIAWLLDLQNADGGIPTFCRGWGNLPFDRSGTDLTAHALGAFAAWLDRLSPHSIARRARRAIERGARFLADRQRTDGAWVPLWFGNESDPNEENPTYGTARVLLGLAELRAATGSVAEEMETRGMVWLLDAQNPDGGWGGGSGVISSIEETALAVRALTVPGADRFVERERLEMAVRVGADWLVEATNRGRDFQPSAIGFYFAKLWYFEKLYPLIFTVEALKSLAEERPCATPQ
jgi:squalene-hopene/tetraprenyl-beta-curcumene cyclase